MCEKTLRILAAVATSSEATSARRPPLHNGKASWCRTRPGLCRRPAAPGRARTSRRHRSAPRPALRRRCSPHADRPGRAWRSPEPSFRRPSRWPCRSASTLRRACRGGDGVARDGVVLADDVGAGREGGGGAVGRALPGGQPDVGERDISGVVHLDPRLDALAEEHPSGLSS